jgi:hypothetical protein
MDKGAGYCEDGGLSHKLSAARTSELEVDRKDNST